MKILPRCIRNPRNKAAAPALPGGGRWLSRHPRWSEAFRNSRLEAPGRAPMDLPVQGLCPSCGRLAERCGCRFSLKKHLQHWLYELDVKRKRSASPMPVSCGKSA